METLADVIQCSICLETFTDPRMLPCIHTFCLKCLQQIVLKMNKQQSKGKLHCPICRMEFDIPPQGVDGFQKNFFIHRLMNIATISKPSNKSCDICLESKESDEDEVLPADVYCVQCRKNICRRCSRAHRSISELKDHQLIPLGTEITENMIKTISHQNCPRHKNEQVKMYCSDCKEVICVVCIAEHHQNHRYLGVEKVAITSRQELKEIESTIETCLKEWLKKMDECTDERMNFQATVESIERTVTKRKNELLALIDKCSQSLLEELASIREKRLKKIQNEMEENERQLGILENFKAYCNEIRDKGTDIELCEVVPSLKCRGDKIRQTHRALCRQPTELFQVHFEQTNLEELLKSENLIGRIKISKSEKITKDSLRSISTLDIPSPSAVSGVTKLGNQICVLCMNPNMIRIFHDQIPFDFQMQIEVKQIENLRDIASSETSKCLYIKELGNKCIWKITIDDRRVTKWLTGLRQGIGHLSVTSEGHLLLMTYDHPHEMEIYSAVAELIVRFTLPSDIFAPQHVIRKPNGEFVICHRQRKYGGPWGISRLTNDGRTIISRFIPKDKTEELNIPVHLVQDLDNDRLFVADHSNNRVVSLDPVSLGLMKTILTKQEHGIRWPCRLFYDGNKAQLIVGQQSNNVDVYEFTATSDGV